VKATPLRPQARFPTNAIRGPKKYVPRCIYRPAQAHYTIEPGGFLDPSWCRRAPSLGILDGIAPALFPADQVFKRHKKSTAPPPIKRSTSDMVANPAASATTSY
jgi:hypothetical protein